MNKVYRMLEIANSHKDVSEYLSKSNIRDLNYLFDYYYRVDNNRFSDVVYKAVSLGLDKRLSHDVVEKILSILQTVDIDN